MAVSTRGPLIRRFKIVRVMSATIAIPAELRGEYADSHDILVVLEVKRHRLRVALAVSSGGELVLPDWLRLLLPILAEQQKVEEASLYLSTRPIWLVTGAQDPAARSFASRLDDRPLWDRLGPKERRAIALRWVSEQLRELPADDADSVPDPDVRAESADDDW